MFANVLKGRWEAPADNIQLMPCFLFFLLFIAKTTKDFNFFSGRQGPPVRAHMTLSHGEVTSYFL